MKKWFSINAVAASGDQPERYAIVIHDYIDPYWGVNAKDFLAELAQIPTDADIHLSINSYGGDVFEGLAIYNALKARADHVYAEVVGVACSIASIILMAAGKITMPENAYVMIHGCSGMVWGTQSDVRDYADVMGKINDTLARIYLTRTGADEATVRAWMSKDTYFDGAEALAVGLCDETEVALQLAACTNMQALQRNANAPDGFKALFRAEQSDDAAADASVTNDAPVDEAANEPLPVVDADNVTAQAQVNAMQACLQANEPLLARCVTQAGFDLAGIHARLERAAAIRALAALGHYPTDKADELVLNDSPIASARAVIAQYVASASPAVTSVHAAEDNHRLPATSTASKPTAAVLDVAGIYAQRKQ